MEKSDMIDLENWEGEGIIYRCDAVESSFTIKTICQKRCYLQKIKTLKAIFDNYLINWPHGYNDITLEKWQNKEIKAPARFAKVKSREWYKIVY